MITFTRPDNFVIIVSRPLQPHHPTCNATSKRRSRIPVGSAPPLFRGMWAAPSQPTRELGVKKREGGPRKWEAQAVRRENGQRHLSLPVFSHSFFFRPPLTPVTPRLPPLPPPSRPNASRRWFFFVLSTHPPPPPPSSRPNASRRWLSSFFRHILLHHHLPRVQTRAEGGYLRSFNTSPTTTTFLASKREPKVAIFVLSTRLPPPPPPSHPNVSRRWCFSAFRHASHLHLPRVQTQAGGGFLRRSNACATTTSLASKREPEVVFFGVPTPVPPPPPPSRPNVSRRWFFLFFRPVSHHHHLPRVQTRAGGGFFDCFDRPPPPPPPPSRPNASRRWFLRPFRRPATTPPPSCSNASWRWFF